MVQTVSRKHFCVLKELKLRTPVFYGDDGPESSERCGGSNNTQRRPEATDDTNCIEGIGFFESLEHGETFLQVDEVTGFGEVESTTELDLAHVFERIEEIRGDGNVSDFEGRLLLSSCADKRQHTGR